MDPFKEEELAEKRELYKGIYKSLKSWYSTTDESIRKKYGEMPLFWQELEQWSSTKALVKLYLTLEERQQANPGQEVDVIELEKRLFSSASQSVAESKEDEEVKNLSENRGEANINQPKKKRNRWGDGGTTESNTNSVDNPVPPASNASGAKEEPPTSTDATTTETKKPRKSRFTSANNNVVFPVIATRSPEEIAQQIIILNMKFQHLNEKLMTVAMDAARIELDPDRSPSPPPKYDSNGKRTNTREMRMREEYMKERVKVIEELIAINPSYIPPPDYVRQKPFKKLYVPIKEFPAYNFIGLLIGPRGNTQRSMEQETGCKISIRGKGSIKDGRLKNKQSTPDDDDELHVHIQGETEASVERAAALVNKILTPVDDDLNEHKQKQLRELALINGTLKEDEYCPICGEKGHRQFECTNRTQSFKAAGVKCSICGDLSHPTRDCPLKDSNISGLPEVSLDQEYSSFMAELDGKPKNTYVAAKVDEYSVAGGSSTTQEANTLPRQAFVPTSNSTSGQQTIVMPAYVDNPAYAAPQNTVWNGLSYVPVAYAPPMGMYGHYPANVYQPPAMNAVGGYYPPQDMYANYAPQPMNPWGNIAQPVANTVGQPPLPQAPPPPSMPPRPPM